ncbi:MAG: hypothetical protein AB8F74_13940 [Saprospiraceae bacterium]
MKKAFYLLLTFLFLLITFSCEKNSHVKSDMIGFDRAYIPVFYYTTLGDLKAAQKSMYVLKAKWQHYQSAHHPEVGASEDWKETIRLIGTWLDETDCALEERDVALALIQLDHARYELVDLRIREGIDDYYLDYLWDLEASMYSLMEISDGRTIDSLELCNFDVLIEEIEITWGELVNRDFDEKIFECDKEKMRSCNYRKDRLGYAVFSLSQAAKTENLHQLVDAALALEPAYLNYISMFGDFESVETYYALKK